MSTSSIVSSPFSSISTNSINSSLKTTIVSLSAKEEDDAFEKLIEKATLDQSCIDDKDKANLMSLDLWVQSVKDITIVDAKESGIECDDIRKIIYKIAAKELEDTKGMIRPSSYVQDEYFNGSSRTTSSLGTEAILLAKSANKVIGFIITNAENKRHKKYCNVPDDTSFVAYLAVDSDAKRSGVGTKLMLAAMLKTKQLGNQYLALEYIAGGLRVDKEVGETRINFYNSFTKRFGIPKKIGQDHFSCRQLHVFPYYDLKNFNFNGIVNTLMAPVNNKCIIDKNPSIKTTSKKSCYIFLLLSVIIGLGIRVLIKRLPE